MNSKRLIRITLERWAFDPWLQELALEDPKLRDLENPIKSYKPPKWSKQGKELSVRHHVECLTAHRNAGGLPGMWTLIFSGTFLDGHWGSRCGQWACLLRLACTGPVQIVRI